VKIQKSFQTDGPGGKLYLVPTPIGNLEDITLRALRVLKEADVIAAEDTRVTMKLLNHFQISGTVVSYHEHNKNQAGKQLLKFLKEGKEVALVCDAGTPGISDPGYEMVELCIEADIPVIALPGANAALTALTASGILPQPFYFYGFLPRKQKEKREVLEGLARLPAALVFYEAPHRLKETLAAIRECFGDRRMTVARELTKRFEEYVRGRVAEIAEWAEKNEPKGEFCLIVEGQAESDKAKEDAWWAELTVTEHVNRYADEGLPLMEAIKKAAKDRKRPKREIYKIYHGQKDDLS